MLGFFKKKIGKDPYLERVASILHQNMGSRLPLENAYLIAEESLHEIRIKISKGMFHGGSNPRENILAYYSLCSMVHESDLSDDKITLLHISLMAQLLKKELGEFEDMSSLEKGIWQFGEQALSEGSGTYTKEDIEKIKSDALQIIMDLTRDQEVTVSQQDLTKAVENVSSNMGDREVSKVGKELLAVSVLSNATGYYIDQGETDIACSYFMCIGSAVSKYFDDQMESYSDYQSDALRVIMQDYRSLGEELMINSNEPFERITKDTNISIKEIAELLKKDMKTGIEIIRDGGINGNLNCQIFLSNSDLHFIMENEKTNSLPPEVLASIYAQFEKFTKLAAEQGDADSQYNLAKFYLCKIDIKKEQYDAEDFSNGKLAKYWYEQARLNGRDDLEGTISNVTDFLQYEP